MDTRFLLTVLVGIIQLCMCKGQNVFQPLVGNSMSDIVSVEQAPGNDHELFPDSYSVWFYHNGEPMYIDLVRDDSMTDSLSPSLVQHSNYIPNKLMNEKNKKEFAFYQNNKEVDSEKRAHFVLHRPDLSRPAHVYGQINHDGYMYTLQSTGNANEHRIRREARLAEHRAKRDVPIEAGTYITEVAIWIAPDLFKFHKDRLGLSNSETSTWFETFRAALMRDVDLTFQKITAIDLRIHYVGGSETTKTSESYFADNYKDPFLADQDTLSDFTPFIQSKIGKKVPQYDTAVLLTRADLAKNTNGDKSNRQAAATGSICADNKGSSVSIAEVSSPFYRKIVAQAIGLGFGLSFEFGSDIYRIMARDNPSFPVPLKNKDDIFLFGNTREKELETTIKAFGTKCLNENGSGGDFAEVVKGEQMGLAYTNDEQCDILYGSGSTICAGSSEDLTCYSDMQCSLGGKCEDYILLGYASECDAKKSLGCNYAVCDYQRPYTSSSSSSSSSSSTTPSTTTSFIASSSPSPDCCCERRPLGQVKIDIEYIPCPDGNPDRKFIVE